MSEYTCKTNYHNSYWEKHIFNAILEKGLNILWDRRTEGEKKERLRYGSITTPLDHITLCYLQNPTLQFFCLSASFSAAALPGAISNCKLCLSQLRTDSNWLGFLRGHLHISFHTPMTSDQPCDCFRLFTKVRPFFREISDWLLVKGQYASE